VEASVHEPVGVSLAFADRAEVPIKLSAAEVTWQTAPGGPPRLRVQRLALSTPGATAELTGETAVDLKRPAASEGSWRASGEVEMAELARLVPQQLARAE